MHLELTKDQRQALKGNGEQPPRIADPETKTVYVLVREDVYKRWQTMLGDDSICTTAEMLDTVMAEDDANDPTLAFYQEKYGKPVGPAVGMSSLPVSLTPARPGRKFVLPS